MNKVTYKSISKEKKSAQAEFDFSFKNEKLVFYLYDSFTLINSTSFIFQTKNYNHNQL